MIKKIIYIILGIAVFGLGIAGLKYGKTLYNFFHMEMIKHSENELYFVLGGGSNSGLVLGEDKAVLIDTKMGNYAKRLHKMIKDKIGGKELIIINTHIHGDHTRGNHLYNADQIFAGDYSEEFWNKVEGNENLPNQWINKRTTIEIGNEIIEVIPIGSNHTKADLFVYLHSNKILFTGDVFMHNMHAVIIDKTVPDVYNWESTLKKYASGDLEVNIVVPGHGPLAQKEDLLEYAEYFDDFKNSENSLKKLRKKYRKWDALPGMANSKKTFNYFKDLNENLRP